MWRKILLSVLYRVVLAMPEILLKDKDPKRRTRAKNLLFTEGSARTLPPTDPKP